MACSYLSKVEKKNASFEMIDVSKFLFAHFS